MALSVGGRDLRCESVGISVEVCRIECAKEIAILIRAWVARVWMIESIHHIYLKPELGFFAQREVLVNA